MINGYHSTVFVCPTVSEKRVSFLAQGLMSEPPKNTYTDLVFKTVKFNQGGAYSSTTGRFTTKIAGTYVFLASVMSYGDVGGFVRLQLMQDGQDMQWVRRDFVKKTHYGATSLLSVMRLKVGSQVWVKGYVYGSKSKLATPNAYLSGVLIHAESERERERGRERGNM